jgi:hypothetical protein
MCEILNLSKVRKEKLCGIGDLSDLEHRTYTEARLLRLDYQFIYLVKLRTRA